MYQIELLLYIIKHYNKCALYALQYMLQSQCYTSVCSLSISYAIIQSNITYIFKKQALNVSAQMVQFKIQT